MDNNKASFFLYLLLTIMMLTQSSFAESTLWQPVNIASRGIAEPTSFENSQQFLLDEARMQQLLQQAGTHQTSSQQSNYAYRGIKPEKIPLPLPDGTTIYLSIKKSNVLPPELAQQYPEIQTFQTTDEVGDFINGRLDFTPQGFHAMLLTEQGQTIYIDPYTVGTQRFYAVYRHKDQHSDINHQCKLHDDTHTKTFRRIPNQYQQRIAQKQPSRVLRKYRLAVAATAEYTTKQGGTVARALAGIATTINRVNQVYQQYLGVQFTLVKHNDQIIFTDVASDPFSNGKPHLLIFENQNTIDDIIGNDNYDIGHVFGTSGGGLAVINNICSSRDKAKGTSGASSINNDSFYIDFVAHEIGHQLGATHTFNGNNGLCGGSTRTSATAFEPGSGSTIMAYPGICGSDNLQIKADPMFHIGTVNQIHNVLSTEPANSCGTLVSNNNQPPVIDAGTDYVIPAKTPFELKGTATDPENDKLSYSWQQTDVGSSSSVNTDLGNNALFRAYMPGSSPSRTFPILKDILNHTATRGETLPSKSRQLNFKFVVMDEHNNLSEDGVSLTVHNTGSRFALDMPSKQYTVGDTTRISWNVAKTNEAPILCETLDVLLSTDGGNTFPIKLDADVINDGDTTILIPATTQTSTTGRFKIACSNNIFFAISHDNFTLTKESSTQNSSSQPESNLEIIPSGETVAISSTTSTLKTNSTQIVSTVNSGGGSNNFYFLILASVLILFRVNTRYKATILSAIFA